VRAIGRPQGRHAVAGLCAAAAAILLAGCGAASSSGSSAATVSGKTLDIVASLPPGSTGGQVATDVLNAERLAFSQSGGTAGQFQLRLVLAHGAEVSDDARRAVSDTKAIAYLGEIAPGTSGVSVQITNELGMLQVSPTDTAAFLTRSTPGAPGSPNHYYPARSSYGLTFGRVVPTTIAEASAVLARMKADNLTSVEVEHDTSTYGVSVADEVSAAARKAGLTVTSSGAGGSGAKALFYAGLPGTAASHALDAAAGGGAKLFAPSALYNDAFVKGLSAAAQQALTVSSPGVASGSLDSVGQSFVSSFAQHYGHQPAPQAIFGYEAMRAVIAALKNAGIHADQRSTVVTDFRDLTRTAAESALGAYHLHSGDTSIDSFVFAKVSGGALVVSAPKGG
jgi:ABC-type branched-subunit amino acid transport system substrate-binding protein